MGADINSDATYRLTRRIGLQEHASRSETGAHSGQWTILFEDREWGALERVSDERPLADIRLVERLIYR